MVHPRFFTLLLSVLVLLERCEAFGNGYTLASITEASDGLSLTAELHLIKSTPLYDPDIQRLRLLVRYESNDRLRVYISDADHERWEVPPEILPRDKHEYEHEHEHAFAADTPELHRLLGHRAGNDKSSQLRFSYTTNPFGFAVTRRSTGDVVFNSTADHKSPFGNMVFKDQYLEISTAIPSTASLYGLGESTRRGFRLHQNASYSLWNSDIGSDNLNVNLYGSHPFYLDVRRGGVAHGVLLLNSNAMDIQYGGSFLTYKPIGGVFDFYFFGGPSPLSVVQQYTRLVGRPAPMPYWSFGFHQCRYGYKNVSDLRSVVAGYAAAKIPLEVIWADIDHMDDFKDFTLDPVNFPEKEFRRFVEEIHAKGQKHVLIVDAGISVDEKYRTFARGIRDDIFVKRGGAPYLAQVWPGPVYFPDFLNPKSESFWTREVSEFHDMLPFDGLWLDMNEVSNFCSGTTCSLPKETECPKADAQTDCCLLCSNTNVTKWDDPPYKINAAGIHRPLGVKTMAASAVHYNNILEYNAHNLYGLSEVIVTNKALKSALNKRPFILTRSTFVGSGAHAAHWTGDNAATWDDLWFSIPTMLNFGLFGIPMVGADICGFARDTTEELCNRWIQLGSFYPFSRDHSNKDTIRQELYLWKSVTESARKALGLRYRLLPYLYTLSFEAHCKGSPIARPLFFTFPEDPNTLGISTQFLLGKGVLVSPVLKQGATSVDAYFPKGAWYNLFNLSDSIKVNSGSKVRVEAPLDTINVHVHEGTILAMQEVGMTTREARESPFTLLVALGGQIEAAGNLYLDGGEDLEMTVVQGKSSYVEFHATIVKTGLRLRSQVQMGDYAIAQGWILQKITLLGFNSFSNGSGKLELQVNMDGKNLHVSPLLSAKRVSTHPIHANDIGIEDVALEISALSLPIGKNFDMIIPWNK